MEKLYKLIIVVFFTTISGNLFAQVSPDHYLVNLSDKNNSPYSLDNPEAFLSEKAILRRQKYQISYKENDLPVNPVYLDSLKALGLKIVNVSKWLNSLTVYSKDSLLLDTLNKISFVKSVGLNKKLAIKEKKKNKLNVPIKAGKSAGIDSSDYYFYGNSFRQIEMLSGHNLHKEGYRGEGMFIAVLDAGFYKVNELPAFDSIRINNQIVGVFDFVDRDTMVYDAASHGMKVLSTIAGNIPGQLVGTAPKAKYLLLRTEQAANEYIIEEHNWVVAAEYADSLGVDMINSSLGYNDFDDDSQDHTYADMDGNTAMISIGADIAASKGILVVTSAGNEGLSAWKYISAPADADSVLSIGAVTPEEGIAYFSSRGPTSDNRIKPDVCAMGMPSVVSGNSGSVSTSSGTSFSAPIMTGMVACLWQAHPELNNMQIIEAVKRSANRYSQPDTIFGYGIPDFYAAHIYLNTTGSNNEPCEQILNVFPNPFRDYLNIEFLVQNIEIPFNTKLEVFDLQGKKILHASMNELHNNYSVTKVSQVENFTRGIYIIRLTADNQVLHKKVLKL
jgi:subtilisin family serine protease